ncbi:precorrin-6A reductase [Lachnobacterium bovis]|uniref:precorrin-6A reductase n=1 Tax=Lachnobacterium bovis TaxID=140626 RepID=UPI0003B4629D|nr:bifunctional cobalt-precorrin-7 (C(5))-methyltransferase/cobalt-precorrin-6B (C(15))-methyltransferase [Lachnobacterium bovis]
MNKEKRIVIFSGTTEGRNLSEVLAEHKVKHIVCVATEYGKMVMDDNEYVEILNERLDKNQMINLFKNNNIDVVVDSTHPYAKIVTQNIKDAAAVAKIKYVRLKRDEDFVAQKYKNQKNIHFVDSIEECVQNLSKVDGNILLTTGSKELHKFCQDDSIKNRLIVRVLPGKESIEICDELGISKNKIIAIQGPFSYEMNSFFIKNYDIRVLVSKESGKAGGFDEKIKAAVDADIEVFVIKRPKESGMSFSEVVNLFFEENIEIIKPNISFDITLAGIGLGTENFYINELKEKINKADVVLGAKRMIENVTPKIEKKPYYMSKDIISYLKNFPFHEKDKYNIVVLFSGDVGFYSGCYLLKEALKNELKSTTYELNILPGISSIIYMAAKCSTMWNDAKIMSIHGRYDEFFGDNEILESIKYNKKIFMIVSGYKDINKIGQLIVEADGKYIDKNSIEITVGFNLSYSDEIIKKITVEECKEIDKDGLYVVFIENKKYLKHKNSSLIKDSEFVRDKVPMTKENIRHLVINKLQVEDDSIFLDIGGGSGSISIETAMLDRNIKVFTFENNKYAVELIKKNVDHFGRKNIQIVEGYFPEVLNNTGETNKYKNYIENNKDIVKSAFIGGTRGRLEKMIDYLFDLNNTMRVCVTAVTLESINNTINTIENGVNKGIITDVDISQVSYSNINKVGNYNMFKAQNPIMIFVFNFKPKNK